jgi:hypothetical protein
MTSACASLLGTSLEEIVLLSNSLSLEGVTGCSSKCFHATLKRKRVIHVSQRLGIDATFIFQHECLFPKDGKKTIVLDSSPFLFSRTVPCFQASSTEIVRVFRDCTGAKHVCNILRLVFEVIHFHAIVPAGCFFVNCEIQIVKHVVNLFHLGA